MKIQEQTLLLVGSLLGLSKGFVCNPGYVTPNVTSNMLSDFLVVEIQAT